MRALPVMLLLVFVAFSGCTDDAPADPDDASEADVITTPKDYSYVDNQTDGSGYHIHDYWGGQDNLTVMDRGGSCENCGSGTAGPSLAFATVRPSPNHVVPQGAARIHVTADWTFNEEESQYRSVHLWIKTADDKELQDQGAITPGETFVYTSSNDENDPPHHVLSLWQFQLRAHGDEDGASIADWQYHINVVAERGLPIPAFPPHPDLWQGAMELTLLDGGREPFQQAEYELDGGHTRYCFGGCFGTHTPEDGAVVPYDATQVEVVLEFDPDATPTAVLSFHGADTWDMQTVEPDESDTHRFVYRIPTDGLMTDSPYAKQSLWEFQVTLDQPTPVRAHHGGYSFTVKASK